MKTDGRLGGDPFKGALGDALHAVMCRAGHNIRLLRKNLRLLCAHVVAALLDWLAAFAPATVKKIPLVA